MQSIPRQLNPKKTWTNKLTLKPEDIHFSTFANGKLIVAGKRGFTILHEKTGKVLSIKKNIRGSGTHWLHHGSQVLFAKDKRGQDPNDPPMLWGLDITDGGKNTPVSHPCCTIDDEGVLHNEITRSLANELIDWPKEGMAFFDDFNPCLIYFNGNYPNENFSGLRDFVGQKLKERGPDIENLCVESGTLMYNNNCYSVYSYEIKKKTTSKDGRSIETEWTYVFDDNGFQCFHGLRLLLAREGLFLFLLTNHASSGIDVHNMFACLLAIDAKTGSEVWRKYLSAPITPEGKSQINHYAQQALAIYKNKVAIIGHAYSSAHEMEGDRVKVWERERLHPEYFTRGLVANFLDLRSGMATDAAIPCDGLYAFSHAYECPRPHFSIDARGHLIRLRHVADEVAEYCGRFAKGNKWCVTATDPATGTEVWRIPCSFTPSSICTSGDQVFISYPSKVDAWTIQE